MARHDNAGQWLLKHLSVPLASIFLGNGAMGIGHRASKASFIPY
jgi:hypothetical protein